MPQEQAGGSLWGVEVSGGSRRFRRTIWSHYAAIVVGLWLVTSPATLGYGNPLLAASDVASGVAAIALGMLSLSPRRGWARWGNTFVGLWLLLAPLVFHARSAAAFNSDTLAGILLVTFSTVVPGMPGRADRMDVEDAGPDRPEGWSYNPSAWPQRLVPVVFAVLGFFAARYLTAYQLGHIDAAWDPFFGTQTESVLDSAISQAWPVPDAGLGAIGYVLDALAGIMAGTRRWRTAPWIVILFGVFVIPFGAVSITLVVLQPVAVGAWCTLCLFTALMSLLMIPFALDEVVAAGQFLARARQAGLPFWRTLWFGGALGEPTPGVPRGGGVTWPWSLLASIAIGAYTMAAPAFWGTTGLAADNAHLTGPLVVTIAVVALAEPARALRFANMLLGIWILASPWVLPGYTEPAQWAAAAAGLLLVVLSLPRGKVESRYGKWQRYVV